MKYLRHRDKPRTAALGARLWSTGLRDLGAFIPAFTSGVFCAARGKYAKTIPAILGSLVVLAGFLLIGDFVQAATGLTIQPIKVSHTLKPGESVSGFISLKSASDEPVNVEVSVEDFIPSAGESNIRFVGRAEGVTTVKDWVTIGQDQSFVFPVSGARNIPYTITAPLSAEPGGHYGVAFFTATKIDDQGTLKVGTRLGMLIFITVPGNFLQKGRILDFSAPFFVNRGPVNFKIKFENTGTVHFEPKGTITITNIFGKEVGAVPVAGQMVLPAGIKDLSASWHTANNFLFGRYKAQLRIFDGEDNELTAQDVAFWAFPIWYTIGLIIAVLAIFYGLKFARKKFNISISMKK